MSRLKQALPALASGCLLALCLPRPGLTFLAWFGLVPLLQSIRRGGLAPAFVHGWASGFAFHGLALYWIYSTCRFAAIPIPIALIAWAALALFLGLAWGAAAAFGRWAAEPLPEPVRPFAWAVAWTAVFVLLERWTPRLCTDLFAYSQWRHPALIQSAAALGPHGLGWLIVFVNAALALRSVPNVAASLALFAACWGAGAWCLVNRPADPGPTARVEILQPNVDQYQKWDDRYEGRIAGNFAELLERPRPAAPALVVWPESAVPRWIRPGEPGALPEADPGRKLGAQQIVGVLEDAGDRRHNAALLLEPDGKVRGSYAKRELVPFGEYVPFEWAKSFVGILNQMSGLDAGSPVQPLLQTALGPSAVSICYEAMFPRLIRGDAARGAQVAINVTNDGWYKGTWGPYQHFYANVFRAVENRVTVVRSGNTGISAVIDPWGLVRGSLPLNSRGRLDVDVPTTDLFPARSLAARTGDWFAWTILGLAWALLVCAPGANLRGRP